MSVPMIRSASSTCSSIGSSARGSFRSGPAEGDGSTRVPAEALYLWLSQRGSLESPPGSRMPSQHRGHLAVRTLEPASRPSSISAPTTGPPSNRCFANSRCCASGSICSDANCWQWTGGASRQFINKDPNFTRGSPERFIKAADERLADYLARLDVGHIAEARTSGARKKNWAEKIEGLREMRGGSRCWRNSNAQARARYR